MRTVLVARHRRSFARAFALSAVAVLSAGCGESASDLDSVGSPVVDSTTTPSSTEPAPSATDDTIERLTEGDCPNRSSGSSQAEFTGEETYAAFVTGVDLDLGEVSLDVVQFLVGPDADAAYEAETGDDSGVPNDYWVRNESDVLRSLPVAADARVWLVRLSEDESPDVSTGGFTELPGYLATGGQGSIWWATLEAGEVIELCEQFVP